MAVGPPGSEIFLAVWPTKFGASSVVCLRENLYNEEKDFSSLEIIRLIRDKPGHHGNFYV
jgi:hypothetical protein